MILSSVALAGALGTGTLGAVKYRERKREREMPWTVAAEKMEIKRKRLVGGTVTTGLCTTLAWRRATLAWRGTTLSRPFNAEHLKRFWPTFGGSDIRQQQLAEMSASDPESKSEGLTELREEAEKKMSRYFALSTTSLLLSAGSTFYTPLAFVSVPFLCVA